MKYVNNIEKMSPDECGRSLRFAVRDRPGGTLRDTYFLVDPESSPSKNLKMGLTVVYANGKTTGHAHPEHEEVYYVLQGRGTMIVGDSQYQNEVFHFFIYPDNRVATMIFRNIVNGFHGHSRR